MKKKVFIENYNTMKKSEMINELVNAGHDEEALKKLLKEDIVEIYEEHLNAETVEEDQVIIEENGKKYIEVEIDISSLSQNQIRHYMRTGLI
jgi:hypothetical protein